MKKWIELFCFLLCLYFLIGCNGYRTLIADINLKNENPEYNYQSALQLIDRLSEKHHLKCKSTEDVFVRYCGLHYVHLLSRVDTKTGIFAVELGEFGPVGATKQYEALYKDLSDVIQSTFKKDSIIMNPVRCTPYFKNEFHVQLHDRRPPILYFVGWSVEPEFGNAVALVEDIAKNNGMKGADCYAGSNADRCRWYSGGEYIGIGESVTLELFGDSGSLKMHVRLTDRSCKESGLAKRLYDETLRKMTGLFGEAAITIPQ